MRHFSIFLLLVAFAASSFAQQIEPSPHTLNTDYLKKSRHQKTAAWLLTGAGTVGLLGTLVADINQTVVGSLRSIGTGDEPKFKSLAAPYLLSAASIIGGVSFFIAASKSKKRATAVAPVTYLKLEQGSVLKSTSFGTQRFPAVALKLHL